ncbi:MAG TPA: hypothetical protein DDW52_24780 [Planctomycetaceae bacterium]|nr:hypothetical protein [Planctomycetaceae bacterium]
MNCVTRHQTNKSIDKFCLLSEVERNSQQVALVNYEAPRKPRSVMVSVLMVKFVLCMMLKSNFARIKIDPRTRALRPGWPVDSRLPLLTMDVANVHRCPLR